jgi:hypothetical protein
VEVSRFVKNDALEKCTGLGPIRLLSKSKEEVLISKFARKLSTPLSTFGSSFLIL